MLPPLNLHIYLAFRFFLGQLVALLSFLVDRESDTCDQIIYEKCDPQIIPRPHQTTPNIKENIITLLYLKSWPPPCNINTCPQVKLMILAEFHAATPFEILDAKISIKACDFPQQLLREHHFGHINVVHCPTYGDVWALDDVNDNGVKTGAVSFWWVFGALSGLLDQKDLIGLDVKDDLIVSISRLYYFLRQTWTWILCSRNTGGTLHGVTTRKERQFLTPLAISILMDRVVPNGFYGMERKIQRKTGCLCVNVSEFTIYWRLFFTARVADRNEKLLG